MAGNRPEQRSDGPHRLWHGSEHVSSIPRRRNGQFPVRRRSCGGVQSLRHQPDDLLVSGDGELGDLDPLRRMPVFGDGKWKIWVAGTIFVVVTGFALRQYQSTFGPKLPDWIQL